MKLGRKITNQTEEHPKLTNQIMGGINLTNHSEAFQFERTKILKFFTFMFGKKIISCKNIKILIFTHNVRSKKILRDLKRKRFFTWAHNRNLCHETFLSFVQNLKRFRGKKNKLQGFLREKTEPVGFVQNLFRFCAKLNKVSWQRFRLGAQVKNLFLFKFRRIFYCFFRHLNSFGS